MDSKQIREIYGPDVEIRKLSNVKVLTPDGLKPVSMIKSSRLLQGFTRGCRRTESFRQPQGLV